MFHSDGSTVDLSGKIITFPHSGNLNNTGNVSIDCRRSLDDNDNSYVMMNENDNLMYSNKNSETLIDNVFGKTAGIETISIIDKALDGHDRIPQFSYSSRKPHQQIIHVRCVENDDKPTGKNGYKHRNDRGYCMLKYETSFPFQRSIDKTRVFKKNVFEIKELLKFGFQKDAFEHVNRYEEQW
jgi:hypothetical protein